MSKQDNPSCDGVGAERYGEAAKVFDEFEPEMKIDLLKYAILSLWENVAELKTRMRQMEAHAHVDGDVLYRRGVCDFRDEENTPWAIYCLGKKA